MPDDAGRPSATGQAAMLPEHAFHCEHSTLLVLLSYTVSVLGAYCGLQWAALIPHVTGSARAGRVAAAAVATGGGAIWSMHFIAMIACRLPVPVTYHLPLTLTSMAVAIAVTGLGLHVVPVPRAGRAPPLPWEADAEPAWPDVG